MRGHGTMAHLPITWGNRIFDENIYDLGCAVKLLVHNSQEILVIPNLVTPNNACTRLGVRAAFFGHFPGSELVPFRWRVHPPTPSG